ncbi:unnamed protein product [Owenia fusiformis]|uniref:Mutator-like transposase domain-containing protein n=1 Tax=Owenia fusiformis TaxID=6347 RepID=A0A8S4PUL7_OWEFU|nr:unnamed protein product [Owenia fusiformis]
MAKGRGIRGKFKYINKGSFQKNHEKVEPFSSSKELRDNLPPRKIHRLSKDMHDLVLKQFGEAYVQPDIHGNNGSSMVLRPKPAEPEPHEKYTIRDHPNSIPDENIIVSQNLLLVMMNSVFTAHSSHKPERKCMGDLTFNNKIPFGLCWKVAFQCEKCNFISPLYQLYEEVESEGKKGRKAAKLNTQVAVALQEVPIGIEGFRKILATCNIKPSSSWGMHKMSSNVSKVTQEICDKDLEKRCKQIIDINKMRGVNDDQQNQVSISTDAMYDSNVLGDRSKMGQHATRAVSIATENNTSKMQILSYSFKNKSCWRGAALRSQGFPVKCPGHENCSANMNRAHAFTEYDMGHEIASKLDKAELNVGYITTDGDAKGSKGVQDYYKSKRNHRVKRLSDRIHKEQLQYTKGVNTQFSRNMFEGTIKECGKLQKAFMKDVKYRCSTITRNLAKKHHDLTLAASTFTLIHICKSIIHCYDGRHDICKKKFNGCEGKAGNNWLKRSIFLKACGLNETNINMTDEDKDKLREIVELRLGPDAIEQTRYNTHTNKCESVNAVINKTLPKRNVYSATAYGRLTSAILQVNHGLGNSTHLKLKSLRASLPKGSSASIAIHKMQRRAMYFKKYKTRRYVRSNRAFHKAYHLNEYFRAADEKKQIDYMKYQLDRRPILKGDHNYAAPPPRFSPRRADHTYALRKVGK